MTYLSKSDFQLASTCPKKLVYKKKYYPTSNDTNEYMDMLAQGGYIVGKMATLLYPDGIEIEGNTKDCILATNDLLQRENVVLFEAAIESNQKLIRIDILEKKGNHLHLIEVKSKSHNSEEKKEDKGLHKYIEDVAYQYFVLSECFPQYNITCSLLMPDKSISTPIDELANWFSIIKQEKITDAELDELPAQQRPAFNKPDVLFKYENHEKRDEYIHQLRTAGILGYKEVTNEVIGMQSEIQSRASNFISILNNEITNEDYQISKICKGCEFNTPEQKLNGFKECWGELAYTEPNIFDLYYGGSIGSKKKGFYLNELIDNKKTSLFDIDIERLRNAKGEMSKRGERQLIQIKYTKENNEWLSPEMKSTIKEFKYPLHFIDFETYTGALPYHKNMRPFELLAFQWSCHTINSPGATPVHSEWIHTGEKFTNPKEFPNFEFARSLKKQIGNTGTPFMWSSHENTVLRSILKQMETRNVEDKELEQWLRGMTHDKDDHRVGRWIDMNQLALKYYFHPYMKGKTSIKKVLPAIWSNFNYLHEIEYFKEYKSDTFIQGILDPYDTLATKVLETDIEEDVVKGGTDAMRAYQRIRMENNLNTVEKDEIRRQLLEYCKLDTMAMVIIWEHWRRSIAVSHI